jgi:Flp pilus assembly pilin Flp
MHKLIWDRRGVTALEYAIIAGIMIMALAATAPHIGHSLSNVMVQIGTSLP